MLFIILLGICGQLISPVRLSPIAEQDLPKSLCPNVVKYEFVDKNNGKLDMALEFESTEQLHGVWIRIVFDKEINSVSVHDDNFEVERRDGQRGILIRSRDLILSKGRLVPLKLSVEYAGLEVPNVIEYRLNGATICPNPYSTKPYPNDAIAGQNFVESLISKSPKNTDFKCGQLLEDTSDIHQWQASIFFNRDNNENYTCEGMLISPKHVITAAHCVTYLKSERAVTPESLTIYFGKNYIDENKKSYSAKRIVLYPGYREENLLNDIALIELGDSPKDLEPICLPDQLNLNKEIETLVGYKKENNKFTHSGFAKIYKVEDQECFKKSDHFKVLLGDNDYCAAFLKGNAACVGDSGSASILFNGNNWELRGIVSAGSILHRIIPYSDADQSVQTCDNFNNLVLVDIFRYKKWINKIIVS